MNTDFPLFLAVYDFAFPNLDFVRICSYRLNRSGYVWVIQISSKFFARQGWSHPQKLGFCELRLPLAYATEANFRGNTPVFQENGAQYGWSYPQKLGFCELCVLLSQRPSRC